MKKIIATAVLSAAFAAPAFADTPFYALLDYSSMSFSGPTISNNKAALVSSASAFRIGGGYQIDPMLSVEAAYSMIGNQTVSGLLASDRTLGVSGYDLTTKVSSFQVAAVGKYAINSSFDVIGKLGLAVNSATVDNTAAMFGGSVVNGYGASSASGNATSLMYGIAGQYNINKQIGIRLGYNSLGTIAPVKNSSDITATEIYLGTVYQF